MEADAETYQCVTRPERLDGNPSLAVSVAGFLFIQFSVMTPLRFDPKDAVCNFDKCGNFVIIILNPELLEGGEKGESETDSRTPVRDRPCRMGAVRSHTLAGLQDARSGMGYGPVHRASRHPARVTSPRHGPDGSHCHGPLAHEALGPAQPPSPPPTAAEAETPADVVRARPLALRCWRLLVLYKI